MARDRSTRKHMCHVFRCDMPARTIANTLRDICKKIMIERSLQQNLAKPIDINGRTLATRPTNLPTEHRRFTRNGQSLVSKFHLKNPIKTVAFICKYFSPIISDTNGRTKESSSSSVFRYNSSISSDWNGNSQ